MKLLEGIVDTLEQMYRLRKELWRLASKMYRRSTSMNRPEFEGEFGWLTKLLRSDDKDDILRAMDTVDKLTDMLIDYAENLPRRHTVYDQILDMWEEFLDKFERYLELRDKYEQEQEALLRMLAKSNDKIDSYVSLLRGLDVDEIAEILDGLVRAGELSQDEADAVIDRLAVSVEVGGE